MFDTGLEPMTSVVGGRRLDKTTEPPKPKKGYLTYVSFSNSNYVLFIDFLLLTIICITKLLHSDWSRDVQLLH